jgi:hypothetical protein
VSEGEDLMAQARDVGKARVEFGKKTGKFLFNATKLGIQKLADQAKKINNDIAKEKKRMAEWPDECLLKEAKKLKNVSKNSIRLNQRSDEYAQESLTF